VTSFGHGKGCEKNGERKFQPGEIFGLFSPKILDITQIIFILPERAVICQQSNVGMKCRSAFDFTVCRSENSLCRDDVASVNKNGVGHICPISCGRVAYKIQVHQR